METILDEQIRVAVREWEARENVSLREHARRLGVPATTLSKFLNGGPLGVTIARALYAAHPEYLRMLIGWLEAGTVTTPRRV